MSDTPERPDRVTANPIGREWIVYAMALEIRVKEQEAEFRAIADWLAASEKVPMDAADVIARCRALSADTEAQP